MTKRFAAALLAMLAAPSLALAHAPDGDHAHGFAAGALHPLTGLDHLLAMIAVGIWGAAIGGRAAWLLPAMFVSGMALGIAGPVQTGLSPTIEMIIGASVIGLGALVALNARLPLWLASALVAFAGAAHGAAHAIERHDAQAWTYAGGALLVTALLHAAGVGAGLSLKQSYTPLLRIAGVGVALTGALIAVQ